MLQTGVAEQRCEVGEGVRCLDLCWGQLFLGTEGGCGARWNFKVSFFHFLLWGWNLVFLYFVFLFMYSICKMILNCLELYDSFRM